MKKISLLLLVLLYLLSFTAIPCMATQEESSEIVKDSVRIGSHSLDGQMPVLGSGPLITNARSAILYEVNTQTLMHAFNPDERLAPASFVKVLTALVAIEQGDLSATVTVKQSVLDSVAENAMKTDFFDGEQLTLQDLLHCMLVDSGNDAAALIADHIAGSQSAFVQTLNTYASELGCTNTNFTNAHGLHEDNQYMSARDMGRIMAAAVQNETFCEVLGAVFYTVPATHLSEERHLISENYLVNPDNSDHVQIYYDDRVLGARTGVAQDGSRCIATVAEDNGLRFVSVIMGAQSVYEENGVQVRSFGGYTETSDLLDIGFEGYTSCQLIYKGQVLKQKKVLNGDCSVSLGAVESASTILPSGVMMADITVQYSDTAEELTAPIEAGQILSTVKYMYGNSCVAQTDLYALNDVQNANTVPDNPEQTVSNPSSNKTLTGILIGLVIVIILVAAVRVVKIALRNAAIKRSRNHRQDRRRSR